MKSTLMKTIIITALLLSAAIAGRAAVYCVTFDGAGNGSSWSNPCSLSYALNDPPAPGDEIHMMGYTDPQKVYTRTSRIDLYTGVSLRGGYIGNGNDRADDHKTVISGPSTDCVLYVYANQSSPDGRMIDYLTIKGGGGYSSSGYRYGGGIYCLGSPTITHCVISNNSANFGGGIYAASGTSPVITWNVVEDNTAPSSSSNCGVGIYMYGGTLEDNTICDNVTTYAYVNGYGLYLGSYANPSSVARNTISGNGRSGSYSTKGGGVYASGCSSSLSLSDNTISGNHATSGAGIYWSTPGTIRRNAITSNHGDGVPSSSGGGIYWSASTSNAGPLYSNVIAGNTGTSGAGVYIGTMQSTSKFVNNTVVDHSGGSGIYLYNPASGSALANSIISGNSPYGIIQSGTGSCVAAYSCFYGNGTDTSGNVSKDNHCITQNPGLDSSYHIGSDSPCIDTGDDSTVGSGWMDIDGELRIRRRHVDIGADEVPDTTPPTTPEVTADWFTNVPTTLHASWTSSDAESDVVEYEYAIGPTSTDPGSICLRDWLTTTATSIDSVGAPLADGTYYFYVKAQNGDGLWSDAGVSNGVIVDTLPPTVASATADSYQGGATMTVNYSGATDAGSGLYFVRLWYKKGSAVTWTDAGFISMGASGSFAFTPDGIGTYHFAVMARDNAGNDSALIPVQTNADDGGARYGIAHSEFEYLYPGGPVMEASARKVSGIPARAVGYVYGNEGELRHMTGDADSTEVFYDCLYRPYQVWDGPDRINWYSYDLAGCPTEMDYPKSSDGHGGLVGDAVHFTTYNDAGELIESVDPNGVARDYVRNDGDGLITDIIPSSGPGVHISYDGVSWRVSSASRDGVAQKDYAYYSSGLLKSATTTFADLADRSYTVTCDYWDDGSLKGLVLSANGQSALSYAYEYDTFGRIVKVSRYDGSNALRESTSWVYVGDTGLIDTQTVADGSNATIDKTIYYYGPMGILTGQVNKNGSDAVLSSFGGISYDAVGNLLDMSAFLFNVSDLTGPTSYVYDHLDRLTSETSRRGGGEGYVETFDYDAFHNLTTFRGASRDFNVNNQDTSFAFTSNGDPTEYGTNVVPGWDCDDNLVSYTIGSGTVMTADYGPDGLRAWKQTGESSTRRYFVYFAGAPICELNASGYIIATNTFGPTGLVSRHEYAVNSSGGVTGSQHFYYTFDPLGHVCQIQNAGGAVVASLAYDAYGQPITGSGTNPTPYGYGGQAGYYTDPETHLILCSLRYYDPSTGRWLNRDPIGYGGGRNMYAYCGGNPVGALDAWGLAPRPGFLGYLHDSWDFLVGEGKGLVSIVNPMTYYNGASYLYDIASTKGMGAAAGGLWRGIKGQALTLWDAKDAGAAGQVFGPFVPAIATAGLGAAESLGGAGAESAAGAEASSASEFIEGSGGEGNVYTLVDKAGNERYVGQTTDVLTRKGYWDRMEPDLDFKLQGRNLTKIEADGLEQIYIEGHGGASGYSNGGSLLNKINNISPNNPYYSAATNAAYGIIK